MSRFDCRQAAIFFSFGIESAQNFRASPLQAAVCSSRVAANTGSGETADTRSPQAAARKRCRQDVIGFTQNSFHAPEWRSMPPGTRTVRILRQVSCVCSSITSLYEKSWFYFWQSSFFPADAPGTKARVICTDPTAASAIMAEKAWQAPCRR